MILGIAFLGQERRPFASKLKVWLSHSLGGAIGGAVTALCVWILMTPFRTLVPQRALLAGSAAFFLYLAYLGATGRRLWNAGLVPQTWPHDYGESLGWTLLGGALGSGLVSHAATPLTYGAFFVPTLLLPAPTAMAVGMLYGFTRTFLLGLSSFAPNLAGQWAYYSGRGPQLVGVLSALFAMVFSAIVGEQVVNG